MDIVTWIIASLIAPQRLHKTDQMKIATESAISKCCGGDFDSCARTADTFREMGGHDDMESKYLSLACKAAHLRDCEEIAEELTEEHAVCDVRDLYR